MLKGEGIEVAEGLDWEYKEYLFKDGKGKREANRFAKRVKAKGYFPHIESIINWWIPKNMGMGQIIGYSVRWLGNSVEN